MIYEFLVDSKKLDNGLRHFVRLRNRTDRNAGQSIDNIFSPTFDVNH